MRSLKDELINEGATNLTGWTLTQATGVSTDGRTIVGVGTDPAGHYEAWLARLSPADTTAPTTAIALAGPAGPAGSYAGPVTVTLTASDPDNAPNTLTTIYTFDGGPVQTYTGPFTIAADGVHTLTYLSFDPIGNLEPLHTLTLIISSPTPLAVSQTIINGGAAQRSNDETVAVRFNHPTNLPQLIASGAVTSAVRLVDSAGHAIPLAASRYQYDQATNVLTVDLTTDGFGGSRATMLADGRYRLLLDAGMITALVDPASHLSGVSEVDFFQLLGDYNGDGVVNLADRAALLAHFGQSVATSPDAYLYDLDGNGVVNLADYLLWARRIGTTV
jgi:hypothetical protein